MKTRRNNKQSKRRGQNPRAKGEMVSHPPQIPNLTVTHGVRMRFIANAAFAANVTFQNLLDIFLVATSSTAGFDLFHTVKIRAIEAWAVASSGNAETVLLIYDGATAGILGDFKEHSDTSMGIQPAHIKCKPSPKSLASDYQLSSGTSAFFLGCPSGTVIDVELTFQQYLSSAVAAQNALVGATTGASYVRGLDGVATATTKLQAVASTVI